jgi:hypothetical protein
VKPYEAVEDGMLVTAPTWMASGNLKTIPSENLAKIAGKGLV